MPLICQFPFWLVIFHLHCVSLIALLFMLLDALLFLQKEIKTIVDKFVPNLTEDIIETRNLFENGIKVCHPHIPPLANELLWLNSLKERLKVLLLA